MVAGHLREQNGIYQIILSYKDANGKRKTKQISTGLKIRGNARNAFGDSYNKEFREYINVDPMGNLIKPNFVTQHFRLICDKNELKHIRFHDLRHSCATLLYDSGIDMKAIQEWLGHSNISTTMNIYAHLNYKNKVISANAIAGIIPNYKEKEPRAAAN